MTLNHFLLFLTALLSVVGLIFFLLRQRRPMESPLLLLQQQLDGLRQEVRSSLEAVVKQLSDRLQDQSRVLADSGRNLDQRLDNAAKAFANLNNEIGQLKEGSKRVFDVGKDISLLQESLRAPKFRGGFGEFFLGDLLSQVLPTEHFALQYAFKSGERVDAVVFSKDGLVPIDSKFPLENFRRLVEAKEDEERKVARRDFVADVKRHVDSIAAKYICPDEGTLNFAFMYIPAENIYYETIIKDEEGGGLLAYSQSKRVFSVSPNSFYAYLQTICMGLRGLKIEEWARELDARLERLRTEFARFSDEFGQIGTHLKNARGKFETAEKRLDLFGERLQQMTIEEEEKTKTPALKSIQS